MTRLHGGISKEQRRSLSIALADTVIQATDIPGSRTVVVSDDHDVRRWALANDVDVANDGRSGLNAAMTETVRRLEGDPWVVVHADLPLLDASTMERVVATVENRRAIIAPSLDGGTNVIGGIDPISFSYGPDSFSRHLAMMPGAEVMVSRRLAVEVDTLDHFRTLESLGFIPRH